MPDEKSKTPPAAPGFRSETQRDEGELIDGGPAAESNKSPPGSKPAPGKSAGTAQSADSAENCGCGGEPAQERPQTKGRPASGNAGPSSRDQNGPKGAKQ